MPAKRQAPRKGRTRPRERTQHRVMATVHQEFELTKRGYSLSFVVRRGGRMVGVLQIGKGSVIWESARSKTRHARLSWGRFVRVMEAVSRNE